MATSLAGEHERGRSPLLYRRNLCRRPATAAPAATPAAGSAAAHTPAPAPNPASTITAHRRGSRGPGSETCPSGCLAVPLSRLIVNVLVPFSNGLPVGLTHRNGSRVRPGAVSLSGHGPRMCTTHGKPGSGSQSTPRVGVSFCEDATGRPIRSKRSAQLHRQKVTRQLRPIVTWRSRILGSTGSDV